MITTFQIDILREARAHLDKYFQILPGVDFGIAGGKVTRTLHALIHQEYASQDDVDADIFFTDKQEQIKASKILGSLCRHSEKLQIVDHYTIPACGKIDIIKIDEPLYANHLDNFDLSVCQVMFTRTHFYSLYNAYTDIANRRINMHHVSDPMKTFKRALKYATLEYSVDQNNIEIYFKAIRDQVNKAHPSELKDLFEERMISRNQFSAMIGSKFKGKVKHSNLDAFLTQIAIEPMSSAEIKDIIEYRKKQQPHIYVRSEN